MKFKRHLGFFIALFIMLITITVYAVGSHTPIDGNTRGNKKLTANWTANSVKVTFDPNGGTGSSTQTFTSGKGQKFADTGISRTGYTLIGWSDNNKNSKQYDVNSGVADDWIGNGGTRTVYACWKVNYYQDEGVFVLKGFHGEIGTRTWYNNGVKMQDEIITQFHKWSTGGNYDETRNIPSPNLACKDVALPNGFYTCDWIFSSTQQTGGRLADFSSFVQPADDVTINYYAQPHYYTITYNLNGSANNSDNPPTYNVLYGVTLKEPTKTGYTFKGWSTDSAGKNIVTGINEGKNAVFTDSNGNYSESVMYSELAKRQTGNVQLYANWKANTYNIVFHGNGSIAGSMANQKIADDASQTLTPNAFIKTGYTFVGWATSASGSKVYDDKASVKNLTATANDTIDLYALWKANDVKVTFNKNDGTNATNVQTFTAGKNQSFTDTGFTRKGYELQGWASSANASTYEYGISEKATDSWIGAGGEKTLYAVWKVKTYHISYNANGGTGTMGTQDVKWGDSFLTLQNTFTRTGYTFKGWRHNSSSYGTGWLIGEEGVYETGKPWTWTIDENSVFYALWDLTQYTITYNLDNGTIDGKTSYTIEDDTFTLPIPTKTGYAFSGWTGDNGTTPQTVVTIAKGSTGNKSYTANWEKGKYTITYNLNDGGWPSGADVHTSYAVDSDDYTVPHPIRAGYDFLGWSIEKDAANSNYEKDYTIVKGSAGNITLTAHWSDPITYSITYNLNGGSVATANPTSYNVTQSFKLNNPTFSGYTFTGWVGSNGAEPQTDITLDNMTGDRNYSAVWKQDFAYTGSVQTFTAPKTGVYRLEAWGAQGGGSSGGAGGYSKGNITLSAGEKLYVYVGGQGSLYSNYKSLGGGGWNGGGDAALAYGGGGMTHISRSATDDVNPYSETKATETGTYPAETVVTDTSYQGRTEGTDANGKAINWRTSSGNKNWVTIQEFTALKDYTITFISKDPQADKQKIDPVGRILVNGVMVTEDDDGGGMPLYDVRDANGNITQGHGYNFKCVANVKAGDIITLQVSSYRATGATLDDVNQDLPDRKTYSYEIIHHEDGIKFDTSKILIVAGGGGGTANSVKAHGGSGGGTTGGDTKVNDATSATYAGTQTSGYKQGCGQSAGVFTESAGAGGGWYGGKVSDNNNGGAGGGSGYLSPSLTNSSMESGQQYGNGMARITFGF